VEAACRIRTSSFVLDGEAVLLGVDGRLDFDGLHSHQHNGEVQFYAFDVLMGDGDDLRKLPLSMRKTNLARMLARRVNGIFLSNFERGEIGPDLFRHACLMGLEGLVSKRSDRLYRAGVSHNRVKIKNPDHPRHERAEERFPMRPYPRGKYLDERLRRTPVEAAVNHVRCPHCHGWIDVSDLGSMTDHAGPLPHPAIDQPQ
jgi:hypothetical protein